MLFCSATALQRCNTAGRSASAPQPATGDQFIITHSYTLSSSRSTENSLAVLMLLTHTHTHTHTHSHRVTKYLEVDGHGLASLYFPDDSQRQRQERPGLLKALLTQGTTPPFASIITHEVLDAS